MIQGCLDNVAAAQEALYSRFSPRMLGVCYRFARNREDAEDMMQEGFIKVFSQIHQFRGQGALERVDKKNYSSYLYKCIKEE